MSETIPPPVKHSGSIQLYTLPETVVKFEECSKSVPLNF